MFVLIIGYVLDNYIIILLDPIRSMQVTVETLGHGFLVSVFSDKSSPGLLVSILEAFDELGLSVLEATASCADTFRLEAVGGEVLMIRSQSCPVIIQPARRCSPRSVVLHPLGCWNLMQNQVKNVDEHVVKQAVLRAIGNCSEGGRQHE